MRTVDATLLAALQAGSPKPLVTAYIGYTNGTVIATITTVYRYVLTGTTLEIELPYIGDLGSDQTAVWLKRGLTIAGTEYTITTGRFYIHSQDYLANSRQVVKAGLFPKQYYAAAANDTYQNVISAFCTAFGKTAVF